MGGQSKSQIVGYKYSLYAHFIFGAGVADFVSKIWFRDSDTIAWQGKQEVNGIININKPELFGGQSSQGGVVGNIAFMNGAVDQMPNAYQVGFRGELTPAYRAVMGIIWQDLNIGMNPYLPTWGVEWSRIHKRISLDGISDRVQWYDEKAAIPFPNNENISDLFSAQHWDYKWFAESADELTNNSNKEITIDLTGWTINQAKIDVPFTSGTANFPVSTVYGADSSHPTVMWYRWNFNPNKSSDISLSISTLFQMDLWLNGNKLDDLTSGSETVLIPKSKLIVGENNVLAVRVSGGIPSEPPFWSYSNDSSLPTNVCRNPNSCYPLGEYVGGTIVTDVDILGIAYEHDQHNSDVAGYGTFTYTPSQNETVIDMGIERTINVAIKRPSPPFPSDSYAMRNISDWYYNPETPAQPNVITFEVSVTNVFDMNPIHILREFKTETWSSARINESLLPDDVWQAAADTVYNESLGMTFTYDGSQSIEGAMAEVCRHIGAETYSDRRTGEFKVKLIRNDYDVETIPSFDESNIIDMSKDDTPVFGQLTTDVVVNYTDTANAFVEASITVQDIALAQQQGKRITANLDYKGFTSGSVAGRKAQQMLNTLSKPLQKRRFVVRTSVGKDLNKGDVFKFSWLRENIVDMVMRITDLNFGNGISNRIMIDAVQDEFAMPAESFIAPPSSDWTPPFSEPTALTDRLIVEAPYLELVQLQGQSIVDLQLSDAPESAYVLAAAGTQSNATKAMMYDGISSYSQVGVLDFCPTAVLVGDYELLDETFTITNGKNLDQIEIGTWCQIDDELLRVDSVSSSTLVLKHGCLDTIPAKHFDGAKVYFWDNASLTDSTEFVDGNTVNVKLLTINPKGQLSLEDAPADSIEMVGRPARPYNMANVKLNDVYYNLTIEGDLVITWANRNRLQQTSGTIYEFHDGNITPEVGLTYTFNLIDPSDDSIVYTVDSITGTTYTIDSSIMEGVPFYVSLQIIAIRDGLESYQNYLIEFENMNSADVRTLTTGDDRTLTDGSTRTTV